MKIFGEHSKRNRIYGILFGPLIAVAMTFVVFMPFEGSPADKVLTSFFREVYLLIGVTGILWTVWAFGCQDKVEALIDWVEAKLKRLFLIFLSVHMVIYAILITFYPECKN
jgi:hypothetical protein